MRKNAVRNLAIAVVSLFVTMQVTHAQLPANYAQNVEVSYIRTWDATAPEENAGNLISRPLKDVKMTTQYYDGLGRPVQTVIKEGSLETATNNKADIVSSALYDAYGREVYRYLPFAANSAGGNSSITDGNFKLNPFQQQETFMQGQYGAQGETYFYSKTDLESSPLSRPDKTMAPGNSWVGSGRGVETKYWANTAMDDVKIWAVTNSNTIGVFGSYAVATASGNNGSYTAGQLYKNVMVDEHGKQVIEFKDKEGKVILKKVQLTAAADDGSGKNYDGWLCTYYIYDDLNNLRCVIQPEGVKALALNGWQLTTILLNEQCFRYEYDQRNRMVMKKVPGAGEVYMVYDTRDRVLMTQDANMRQQGRWMMMKYDDLNRPIETGLWQDPNSIPFATHHAFAYVITNYPTITSGYELLSITHYDDYTGLPSGLSGYMSTWNGYFSGTDNNNWPYPEMPQQGSSAKGMVTWTQVKVLGTASTFLNTVSYYDEKGQAIQVQSTNIDGGTDVVTNQYTWSGQPLVSVQKQQKVTGTAQEHVIVTRIVYDDLGRPSTTKKSVISVIGGNSISKPEQEIVKHEYDKLGQLVKKKLAPAFNNYAGLENINYEYNIRGWLLGANRSFVRQEDNNYYFGFDLGYDKANNNLIGNASYLNPQYNGNIEGMVWRSKGDGERRKYDFYYDAANRLLKADFAQYTEGSFNQAAGINYNMLMGNGTDANTAYDANGNIKAMTQYGWKLGASPQTPIDNMTYTYFTGTNRLQAVADAITGDNKLGDFTDKNTGATDYGYDKNGNLVTDLNKRMNGTTGSELSSGGAITYNHLNLPATITVKNDNGTHKGTITYTYDAAGNKLKKEVAETGQTVKTTVYMAGSVYENNILQFIQHEEGRMRIINNVQQQPAGIVYDYMLKDHLGNVRMVLTEEQKQDIYPAATLENTAYNGSTAISVEDDYYTINSSQVVAKSTATGIPDYENQNNGGIPVNNNPYSNTTANSQQLYKLNGNDATKTGLGITLKVMAGDKIDIFGKSYYFQANTGGANGNTSQQILEILNGLLGGPTGGAAGNAHGGITASQLNSLPATTGGINTMLSQQADHGQGDPPPPLAYINYIFFDDQFKFVNGGFNQTGAQNQLKSHSLQNLTAQKSGYVYIYVSNISTINVFFDNLQVIHTRGAILEETHYYPFGLPMSGISSRALNPGQKENKILYNSKELQSKEFTDGSGMELYDYGARFYDVQIGKWQKIDNKSELYFATTPYAYALNQPTNAIDPDGNVVIFINGNHFGISGLAYWRPQVVTGYKEVWDRWHKNVDRIPNYGPSQTSGFDLSVMKQLGDNNARYYDGSSGGWHPLGDHDASTASGRVDIGYAAGKADAAEIIANLQRDKNGNIIETIKIITHSMGGAYGKGFVKALIEYIKTLPIDQQKQIKITLVGDFDPYQASSLTAEPNVRTMQFTHIGDGLIPLADEKQGGAHLEYFEDPKKTSHSIFSFFSDISKLAEGTYVWNAQTNQWELK